MVLEMDATVGKYGDAIVIRIPPKTAEKLGISVGDNVRIRMQRMKLVPVDVDETGTANAAPARGIPKGGKRPGTFSANVRRVGATRRVG